MCSTSAGARQPPVSHEARLSAASTRSIWRRKDSSENKPSTTPSDEAGCICLAEPVSLSPSSDSSARLGHASKAREGTHGETRELFSAAAVLAPARDVCGSPASFLSLPGTLVPQQAVQQEADESEPELPPILAPLEPLHLPPVRRATPPGLPSYEGTRRPQPRLCGGGGGGSSSTGGGGPLNLRGFFRPASGSRWRRSRQRRDASERGRSHRGNRGHRTSGGSAWRPPASQHSLANHPFLRDMRPADCGQQTGSFGVRQSGCAQDIAPGTSAVATAEIEARAGRAARPVTLNDYLFLRSLNSNDPAAVTRRGPADGRDVEVEGASVPSAVLCLKWCVPPCLCPVMSRPIGSRSGGLFAS